MPVDGILSFLILLPSQPVRSSCTRPWPETEKIRVLLGCMDMLSVHGFFLFPSLRDFQVQTTKTVVSAPRPGRKTRSPCCMALFILVRCLALQSRESSMLATVPVFLSMVFTEFKRIRGINRQSI